MENLIKYIELLEKGPVKETWVKTNLTDVYELSLSLEGETISEKIYRYINQIDSICKMCENKTKFLSYNRGYRIYCSKKCSNSDQSLINQKLENYKSNNIEKYGVDNPSKLDSVKEKISSTKKSVDYTEITKKTKEYFINTYGVDNPSKLESIKLKKIETTNKNWGVDNPFQSEEIKIKSKETMILNYGVEHPFQSKEIMNKITKTNLERYGCENAMQSEYIKSLFRETCLQNWGTEHFRTSELFKKKELDIHLFELNIKHKELKLPNVISLDIGVYKMYCDKCTSEFDIHKNSYYMRKNSNIEICNKCVPAKHNSSLLEIEVFNFIKSNYNNEIVRSFKIDRKEIDIYLPELNLGIEFNGLYWHSEEKLGEFYHLNKYEKCKSIGIKLLQIWEDDWINKKDIIKSLILSSIGRITDNIQINDCTIKNVTKSICSKFLSENHILGNHTSTIRYGLYSNNILIYIMCFNKNKSNQYELVRFCSKVNLVIEDSFKYLLNHFTQNNKFDSLILYTSNDYSSDLDMSGFNIIDNLLPNYRWVSKSKKQIRCNYGKNNFLYPSKKEMDINYLNKNWIIFDSGHKKWKLV